jgi:hypothetical protein
LEALQLAAKKETFTDVDASATFNDLTRGLLLAAESWRDRT